MIDYIKIQRDYFNKDVFKYINKKHLKEYTFKYSNTIGGEDKCMNI